MRNGYIDKYVGNLAVLARFAGENHVYGFFLAFAIDWNGNLVLFNAGTPVVLTPAKLAALIA